VVIGVGSTVLVNAAEMGIISISLLKTGSVVNKGMYDYYLNLLSQCKTADSPIYFPKTIEEVCNLVRSTQGLD
jgi:hypothetical protein